MELDDAADLGQIKIPQKKEILVTLSAVITLATNNDADSVDTLFYSTYGSTKFSRSGVSVGVYAVPSKDPDHPIECQPGWIWMNSRFEALGNLVQGSGWFINAAVLSEIDKFLKTSSAHTFQWICPDMDADTYNIKAKFVLSADAGQYGNLFTPPYFAMAILKKRVLTAQEVRAVEGTLDPDA